VIASEFENIPTGLLDLLDTAENVATKLVQSENRILREEQRRHPVSSASNTRKSKRLQAATSNESQ